MTVVVTQGPKVTLICWCGAKLVETRNNTGGLMCPVGQLGHIGT